MLPTPASPVLLTGCGWSTPLRAGRSGSAPPTRSRPGTPPGRDRADMPLVAGVDSSTQSCTVVVCDADDGRILRVAAAPHPPTTPPVSEQDPAAWWDALTEAFAAAGRPDVATLSIGAQA